MEALNRKKRELGLEEEEKDQIPRGVYRRKTGRWQAVIRHPVTKARICLGTFDTAEEAKEAHDSKRREFDSLFPSHKKRNQTKAAAEQYRNNQRLCHVYPTKSGRWTTEIGHPITKVRVRLGTFDTAEEAKEAYDSKSREFDLMFPGHRKCNQTKDSCDLKADPEQSQKIQRPRCAEEAIAQCKIESPCISDDPSVSTRVHLVTSTEEAEEAHEENTSCERSLCGPSVSNRVHLEAFAEEAKEAYDSKWREFDLMFPNHKKRNQTKGSCNKKLKQSNDSCRGDSACVSDDPSASSGGSMLNANVESVPMLVTEGRGEFDSDVIDSYGQLVGEYSRLDDELWLCRPEDGAMKGTNGEDECNGSLKVNSLGLVAPK